MVTNQTTRENKEREVEEKIIVPYLRDHLGYDTQLMKRNVSVKFGRMVKFADIVFYVVTNDIKRPYLLVESKSPGKKLDILQAESYAERLNIPYFVVTDGENWLWYRTGKEGQESSERIKIEIHPPKSVAISKITKFESIDEAKKTIRYCHNIIWNEKATTPEEALKELSKFLIAKIVDEQEVNNHSKDNYDFKINKEDEDALDIKNRINKLLMKAKVKDEYLFVEETPKISLKPFSVIKIVQRLQNYNLSKTDSVEILGETYQELLMNTYTDKIKGQRFTPRVVVDFMVGLSNPTLSEHVLDPACGTGGFLVSVLKYVKKEIDVAFSKGDLPNPTKKFHEYVESMIFGTDIEPTVVQLAKANMLMHGDGHNHIICHDGLYDSPRTEPVQNVIYDNKGFELIITNPPFGGVKLDPEILYGYELSKKSKSEVLQVLFIERCIKFLKNGGKLAIVLPDGILGNSSMKPVRDFIREHCIIKAIISLPKWAFKPYGANVKTSLIFLQKKRYAAEEQRNVIMAVVTEMGYSVSGKEKGQSELPRLMTELKDSFGDIYGNIPKKRNNNYFVVSANLLKDRLDVNYYDIDYLELINHINSSKNKFLPLIDFLSEPIHRGKTPIYTKKEEIPVIKTVNLKNSKIKWEPQSFVSKEFFEANLRAHIKKDDILLASTGTGSLGKVDIMDTPKEAIADGHIAILRINKAKALPLFILHYLRSGVAQKQIEHYTSGHTGQIELYPKDIEKILVPAFTLDEQKIAVNKFISAQEKIAKYSEEIEKIETNIKNEIGKVKEDIDKFIIS